MESWKKILKEERKKISKTYVFDKILHYTKMFFLKILLFMF